MAAPAPTDKLSYAFGAFTLDAAERVLRREGSIVPLAPKAVEVLCVLIEAQGAVVDKAELLARVWPETHVEESNLTQSIFLVRKAIGQDAIETVPKRGYRFAAAISTARPAPSRRRYYWIAGAIALTVSVAIAGLLRYSWAPPPLNSVAVLPFANLSGDSAWDYVADGVSEELIHALMRLDGVRVAARTSSFQFRGRNEDIRAIGKRLNVAAVLEGSTRIRASKVRVTAQLVDTGSGYHVWSESWDGVLNDLATITQQISTAVARRLAARGTPVSRARASAPDVFLAYLRGRYLLAKGRPETFRQAVECFHRAISADPAFAAAWSGLADTHYRWALWESFPPAEAFAKARHAAERALALDGTLAEAHASLANVRFQYDRDYSGAERAFRRSLELDPRRADTWHWFSHLLTARGRFAEAEEASKKAIELEPFDLPALNHLGWTWYFMRQYDRAIEQHRKVLDLDPMHGQTRLLLGRALLQKQRFAEAIEQLRRNLELSPDSPERIAALAHAFAASGNDREARQLLNRLLALRTLRHVSAYSIAVVYTALGSKQEALASLERALAEHASRIVELKHEPVFDSLRGEKAFEALVSRLGG